MIDRSIASEAVVLFHTSVFCSNKNVHVSPKSIFLKNVSPKSIKNDFLSPKSVAPIGRYNIILL